MLARMMVLGVLFAGAGCVVSAPDPTGIYTGVCQIGADGIFETLACTPRVEVAPPGGPGDYIYYSPRCGLPFHLVEVYDDGSAEYAMVPGTLCRAAIDEVTLTESTIREGRLVLSHRRLLDAQYDVDMVIDDIDPDGHVTRRTDVLGVTFVSDGREDLP